MGCGEVGNWCREMLWMGVGWEVEKLGLGLGNSLGWIFKREEESNKEEERRGGRTLPPGVGGSFPPYLLYI